MRRLLASLMLTSALLAPAMAHAQAAVVSPRAEDVAVTVYPPIYGMGLAMITETRTVDLPAGPVTLSFRGVADQIVPQTVSVDGLPDGVSEQNFDYQLLTPGSLIRESEGRFVSLVRTNPATGQVTAERARVVSGANGALLDIDGRIEALKCADMPERLVFDDLPPGFTAQPTLSVQIVSPRAGRATLTLSYLATGVQWQANYVATIALDGQSLDLSSWITIRNDSETRFPDAPIQVIAGQLQRNPGETQPVQTQRAPFYDNCWQINSGRYVAQPYPAPPPPPPPPMAMQGRVTGGAEQNANAVPMDALAKIEILSEDLGDYKLYTLPEPTTLAARQTKQLLMFDRPGVRFTPVQRRDFYTAFSGASGRSDEAPQPTQTVLELENETENGLGLPLPQGQLAAFATTPHGPMLLGEPSIRDTPQGVPFELALSANPLVQTQQRVIAQSGDGASGRTAYSAAMEVTLTNATGSAVNGQVRERGGAPGLEVARESAPHIMKDGNIQWDVIVPANGSVVLTYALRWGG